MEASELRAWKAKLRWLRLPVMMLKPYANAVSTVINSIDDGKKNRFEPSDLDGYIDEVRNNLISTLKTTLSQISPSGGKVSFESICERIVIAHGYQIKRHNKYDGNGGDIDLMCKKVTSGPSLFGGNKDLIVQIKKHSGTTGDHSVKQLLRMLDQDKLRPDCCVMSLADKFSSKAEELANGEGVMLLNGYDVAEMFLKTLASSTVQD